MYNVNQILDRTFDNWSTMLGANEFSFWAVSVVEMKPTSEIETPTTTTPIEIQEWEPADTTDWTLQSSTESSIETATDTSIDAVVETSATTETDAEDTTDVMSATLHNISETARDALEEFNPFRAPEENS